MQLIFQFLKNISANNNREWFKIHKNEYEEACNEFNSLLEGIIARISTFDKSVIGVLPKDCTYRIYRDVRFSTDKSPFKTHIGGYINPKGKKSSHAGYYVHIQPGQCMLAGGSYELPSNILRAVRQTVYDNIDEYISIVENPSFKNYFPIIGYEFLKTAPKGFPKDFKYMDYLKCKEFSCAYSVKDDFFTAPDVLDRVEEVFRQFKPFADFINFTIDNYE